MNEPEPKKTRFPQEFQTMVSATRFALPLFAAILFSLASVSASVKSEVSALLKDLSTQYLDKRPQIVFQKNVAVLDLKDTTPALKNNKVGQILSSLIVAKLSESTIFHVVERGEGFAAILKEQTIAQSGLVDETTAAKAGQLLGADLILDGNVSELGDSVAVTVRLVSVEKGEVLASKTLSLPRSDVLHEVDAYVTAAFQSPNGINVDLEGGPMINFLPGGNNLWHAAVDVGYRANKYLNFGFGFTTFNALNYYKEQVAITNVFPPYKSGPPDNATNYTRTLSFIGFGPKIFADLTIPVATRFNFGIRGAFGLLPGAHIYQAMGRFPVPTLLFSPGASNFTQSIVNQDFTADSTSLAWPIFVSGELMGDFLITKRVSIGFRVGYLHITTFNPDQFEALGISQKQVYSSGKAEANGSFANLFGYSFNKDKSGNDINFSFSGLMLAIALSAHI